jgi:signal peptidase II
VQARVLLMLVLGGALGNLVDRMVDGAVVDFVDVGIGGARWCVFNLADALQFVGRAGFLALFVWPGAKRWRVERADI